MEADREGLLCLGRVLPRAGCPADIRPPLPVSLAGPHVGTAALCSHLPSPGSSKNVRIPPSSQWPRGTWGSMSGQLSGRGNTRGSFSSPTATHSGLEGNNEVVPEAKKSSQSLCATRALQDLSEATGSLSWCPSHLPEGACFPGDLSILKSFWELHIFSYFKYRFLGESSKWAGWRKGRLYF